ncbi:hypothetical protein FHL15_004061 [Xylaria flabelliformis]|uniref:Uncharacterized protein n=1 Tax=Xylaria flabelliformis TaxID=2512241 RepID=A0A553I440_9PEZI|nr:hypothetical protein FHL15_004061 [Xylaria flabelliformis]
MSSYGWTSRAPTPSHHRHPADLNLGDSDVYAAMRPRYNNNSSVETGGSSNSLFVSNNTTLPNTNASGAASNGRVHYLLNEDFEELFIDNQHSPPFTPLRDTSAAAPIAVSMASHMGTEAPEALTNGSNGMISRANNSTSGTTSELLSGVSSTSNWPPSSSSQPSQSNDSSPPLPPPGTQSSNVHLNILSTFPPLPSLNMTTPAPSSHPATVSVAPQTGTSTSGSVRMLLNQLPLLQIQAFTTLQQHIQPNSTDLDDDVDDDDRDDPVVCVVCGGICKVTFISTDFFDNSFVTTPDETPNWMRPILVQATPRYLEWQKQRPSTRTPCLEEAELIEQIQVTAFLGGSQGMKRGRDRLYINTMDPLMKLPIHKACIQIARIFCKDQSRYGIGFRSASGGAPSSIPQFYEIWCKRAIASYPVGFISQPILEANKYYGAPIYGTMIEYHRAMLKDRSLSRFLAYPLTMYGLTDIVVNSNLQTMDGKVDYPRGNLVGLLGRINNLPQEIADQIIASLEPFEEDSGLPLEPTRVLPPKWWKKKLFSGELIPWLWDLKKDDLTRYRIENFYRHHPNNAARDRERGRYIFDEDMWDWELLCRQLAQPKVMQGGGILAEKSNQLWNRRRIWKLLDAARLGHIQFP